MIEQLPVIQPDVIVHSKSEYRLDIGGEFIPVDAVHAMKLNNVVPLRDIGARQQIFPEIGADSPYIMVPAVGLARYLDTNSSNMDEIWENLYNTSVSQLIGHQTPEDAIGGQSINGNTNDSLARIAGRTYSGLATLMAIMERAKIPMGESEALGKIKKQLGSLHENNSVRVDRVIALERAFGRGKQLEPQKK